MDTKMKEGNQIFPDFLLRVARASIELSRGDPSDLPSTDNASCSSDASQLLDVIAKNTLIACEPSRLLWGTEDLTPIKSKAEPLLSSTDADDDDQSFFFRPYRHRRSDYLRRLLRFMAPISMHVASLICHRIIIVAKGGKATGLIAKSAFILFSHWLHVAPHLRSMVMELFPVLEDPWKGFNADNSRHLFLLVEAAYKSCSFFGSRRQVNTIKQLWDWTFLFEVLDTSDAEMRDPDVDDLFSEFLPKALTWYSARALAALLDWRPQVASTVFIRRGIADEQVAWQPHPWAIEDEEKEAQDACFYGLATLWGSEEYAVPSTDAIAEQLPLFQHLVHVGNGIIFYKARTLRLATDDNKENSDLRKRRETSMVSTATTRQNLALLGAALCQDPYPPPILLCGPQGSGKSSILREMLRLCRPGDALLEFHIDEETDSKTLIGSFSTTDVPGEFEWRPGALTHATREGRWVLFEDIDTVPIEIQATISKLLEDRLLPLGNGKYERAHPDFRIFGTCTTSSSGQSKGGSNRFAARTGAGRRILSPSLWRKVHIEPLPYVELREVAVALYPLLPVSVIEVALKMLGTLDRSGRSTSEMETSNVSVELIPNIDSRSLSVYTGGRNPSVRDFFKLLSRISHGICFERNAAYTTEAQRLICLSECVEILVGSCADCEIRLDFITRIAAPAWGVSAQLARAYVDSRSPKTQIAADYIEIGRAQIQFGSLSAFKHRDSKTFAQTNHALRLMESIGVCVRQNEPTLLVGETGCGKTTVVQQLASLCERELIVQNLSLQTDSTDLLGGFRPLELKNVSRLVYLDFVDLFCSTFSRKGNTKFLEFAASMQEKESWKKLSQCFQKAAKLGLSKMKERIRDDQDGSSRKMRDLKTRWDQFKEAASKFERQIVSCDAGLAFVFAEGALVDAIKQGKWVLLDEINLASSDTLQRLCGLLDDPLASVTLTERGDASEIPRHPNFRLLAAMNPATDAGKKDLPESIRARFTELFVAELLDPVELRIVTARYLDTVLPMDGKPPEHKDIVVTIVDIYLKCRHMAETVLSDGAGHKPRYTLRTLSRALTAARTLVVEQKLPLARALFEGLQLAFEGALDDPSVKAVKKILKVLLSSDMKKSDMDHPGRRPGGQGGSQHVLMKPFWINMGPKEPIDWSIASTNGKSRFILTPSVSNNLRRLARALASGPWPILLEGPTSAGKTSLVEYMAARAGHRVIRINNHEHTDVQEYTGSFAADQHGSLTFRDGLLVQALRCGHWVILDELNLAPSEVLEALNRLLDDNRELYLAEKNEIVKPHPDFRLFATQNPSGVYGGRKPLSRAFRNRFVEIHMGDIPSDEMTTILEKRCGCPPSTATKLVDVMIALRFQRSRSNLFMGKDSFITPRDLLRWAERRSSSRIEFAEQGYMLLAERLRSSEEKLVVKSVLEEHLKVKLTPENMYYGDSSEARKVLESALANPVLVQDPVVASIASTRSLLRLITLVMTCVEQKEPVLLVGDTGCGKTTVVQFLSLLKGKMLHAVNCHATTETSDLLGGLRPVRGRDTIKQEIYLKLRRVLASWPHIAALKYQLDIPESLLSENVSDDIDMQDFESAKSSTMNDSAESMPEVEIMLSIAKALLASQREDDSEVKSDGSHSNKRRKLSSALCSSDEEVSSQDDESIFFSTLNEVIDLAGRFTSLFEWSDGPLVTAMKDGHMLLLDEMSLAEDAVLERLNSVLEPSRTLVLAEKGGDGSAEDSSTIVAHSDFRMFATMNPGGDYGKRELSPALRSRFTEIWVPAVTDREDFELVLSRAFEGSLIPDNSLLVQRMLDYVDWFNLSVCGQEASPCANYTLSLRDVLSWAHFIREARKSNPDLSLWQAYVHGAALMHLDGLGLGAGLALEDAENVRVKCRAYIQSQVPIDINSTTDEHNFTVIRDFFGASPFYIPLGGFQSPSSDFNMAAPTTAMNAFRVLRAMQIKKPILLEGSPGVGKTSLITALAAASGNNLVRINLSEQTDIADLMGSDIPVQDSASGNGAAFEWSDGVLLRAIKDGSWVLLDELNLASQSVLEGLNSCLDHRATIYIPELGKSFQCPPSFRVFGAQNPLGQGGGRKGLPKSFLNRFTKVYVDGLTDLDLQTIISSKYTTFEEKETNAMINFNNAVHQQVVERREFGTEGAPWEFNLRDAFRWCELVKSQRSSIESAARDIYLLRFRNLQDQKSIQTTFQKHFDASMGCANPEFNVSSSTVCIGKTTLLRKNPLESTSKNSLHAEPQVLLGRRQQMEALARCVALQWPCLVIGPSSSGKTSTIASLAEVCNASLLEQCLSPSSDVTELLGCYEQADTKEYELKIAEEACEIIDEFFCINSLPSNLGRAWALMVEFEAYWNSGGESMDSQIFVDRASSLCSLLHAECMNNYKGTGFFRRLERFQASIRKMVEGKATKGSHFVWKDGILVESMLRGYWLVLSNVNLCPSSVLDRLNSVMEIGGELLLSECGTLDPSGSKMHRKIKPHPNFRIFLTMDAGNGEVSRAMRNRCIELFFQSPVGSAQFEHDGSYSVSGESQVDLLGVMHMNGSRSFDVASSAIQMHLQEVGHSTDIGEEIPCVRNAASSIAMLSSLLYRGISGRQTMVDYLLAGYEVKNSAVSHRLEKFLKYFNNHEGAGQILPVSSGARRLWNQGSEIAQPQWEARVLRLFDTDLGGIDPNNDVAELMAQTGPADVEKFQLLGLPREGLVGERLLKLFLLNSSGSDFESRCQFFRGYDGTFVSKLSWMVSFLEKEMTVFKQLVQNCQSSGESSSPDFSNENVVEDFFRRATISLSRGRMDKRLLESQWCQMVLSRDNSAIFSSSLKVLEASVLANEGRIDRSMLPCPVTSLTWPLFCELDSLVQTLSLKSLELGVSEDDQLRKQISVVLVERDRFFQMLQDVAVVTHSSSFLGFDETEFVVAWKWLKRSIMFLGEDQSDEFRQILEKDGRKLWTIVSEIDSALYGSLGDSWSSRSVAKNLIQPSVPRQLSHWETLFHLIEMSTECSLSKLLPLSPFESARRSIDLPTLIDEEHPYLFMEQEFQRNLLAALATLHSYWTDEICFGENQSHSSIGRLEVDSKLRSSINNKRGEFYYQLSLAKVDKNISTVENQFTAEKLNEFKDTSTSSLASADAYNKLTSQLLSTFARVQTSPLHEYCVLVEERNIVGWICHLVTLKDREKSVSELRMMLPRLKSFIQDCLNCASWRSSYIRPYQTLAWAVENVDALIGDIHATLGALVVSMLESMRSHSWSNLFNDVGTVSWHLQVPNMWDDDENVKNVPQRFLPKKSKLSFGSVRLNQQVRTELILCGFAGQMALQRQPKGTRIFTVENFQERLAQYEAITEVLSVEKTSYPKAELCVLLCLAKDVIRSLRNGLKCEKLDLVLHVIENPAGLADIGITDKIRELEGSFTDRMLIETFSPVIVPLLGFLSDAWMKESTTKAYHSGIALSSIYLGLLRARVGSPHSPLDPARAPTAKVSLIDRRLNDLRKEVAAHRLYEGFTRGDFAPCTPAVEEMLEEAEKLVNKRSSQERKIVTRPIDIAPFHELFRLSREFLERVSSPLVVLELVKLVQDTNRDPLVIERRMENWLRTSSSFIERIESEFAAYDDVTTVMKYSIHMIQEGLLSLYRWHCNDDEATIEERVLGNLLRYPMLRLEQTAGLGVDVLLNMDTRKGSSSDAEVSDLYFAVASATLCRLLLKKRAYGLGAVDLKQCNTILRCLSSSNIPQEKKDEGMSLEDIHEQKYREQFPDHRQEFDELFDDKNDDISDEGSANEGDVATEEQSVVGFSDTQVQWLCAVLEELFRSEQIPVSDSIRSMVFHYGYSAALTLERHFECTQRVQYAKNEPMSGHVMAMAMGMPPLSPHTRVFSHLYQAAGAIDFQNEPNPAEVVSARLPLQHLMARSTQLLTAFPGHSILLGIGRVCDKVCKFDVMTTPIGKFMTGMEVVLRQAQEWEQHASERVCLGSPLREVGRLVASWRKLELESWPQLISARKLRYQTRARRHLLRLACVLQHPTSEELCLSGYPSQEAVAVPKWIWRGIDAEGQAISISLENTGGDDFNALIKVLDTFILTAPLGEFEERLVLLKICADHQESKQLHPEIANARSLCQARILRSIQAFYNQFKEPLLTKLESLIRPLESKLKDEVKLAKWDDQTYYALAESTEKNHRKLMKVLAKVDECLDLNVGQLIQEEKVKGIRDTIDSNEGISSTVPSGSAMFPDAKEEDKKVPMEAHSDLPDCSGRLWTKLENISPDSLHLLRIQKYALKMENYLKASKSTDRSFAQIGGKGSWQLFCTILDRIDSLRTKSTRPMKERALTDLFRELKRNGFTSTKWSVPDQLRNIQELFNLPQPQWSGDLVNQRTSTALVKAERYYQRILSELNEYRVENLLLGSRHMTKRQTDMMLTFGESGMLMVAQQRCLLASLVQETSQLKNHAKSLNIAEKSLPLKQSQELSRAKSVDSSVLVAVESLRQLILLIKSSTRLLPNGSKSEVARDLTAKLDGCLDSLVKQGTFDPSIQVLTFAIIEQVDRKVQVVENVRDIVIRCRESCHMVGNLPLDCFDSVIDCLNEVTNCANLKTGAPLQGATFQDALCCATHTVEKSLISFQSLIKASPSIEADGDSTPLWQCHKEVMKVWASSDFAKLSDCVAKLCRALKGIHEKDEEISSMNRQLIAGLVCDIHVLVKYVEAQAENLLFRTTAFYVENCKLVYVLLRVFRVLLSKGFCSDETKEDDASDSGGDVEGMKFDDDQDGTGMGEGDGKRDVTDELENEDQLSGLKNEQEDTEKEIQESRQLNEEEANEGMEMEADFDGEMCDVPDKAQEDEGKEDEGEEELDRELGDEASPDEQVVDERMWNESDDEDDINKEEEKFEKDSGVEGDAIEGAMRTKDDDEENEGEHGEEGAENAASKMEENQKDDQQDIGDDIEDEINDEQEDRYEEQHDVDVKAEEHQDDGADQDDMQLDDNMDLDAEEDHAGPEDGDGDEVPDDDDQDIEGDDVNEMDVGPEPNDEGDDDEEDNSINDAAAIPSGGADRPEIDETPEQGEEEEPPNDEMTSNHQKQEQSELQAHGVRASDGTEGILEDEGGQEEKEEGNEDDDAAGGDSSGAQGATHSQSDSQGANGSSEKDGAIDGAQEAQQEDGRDEIPNPFKNPGDATKFWQKKLNLVENEGNEDELDPKEEKDLHSNEKDPTGEFEYTSQEDESQMQVLGEATEEEAIELNNNRESNEKEEEVDVEEEMSNKKKPSEDPQKSSSRKKTPLTGKSKDRDESHTNESDLEDKSSDVEVEMDESEQDDNLSTHSSCDVKQLSGNHVVADLSKLSVEPGQDAVFDGQMIEDEQITGISSSEAAVARTHWLQIQGETHNLARRLCEKLRLVMEPLVASKLRGDYRTGKRINMKRVIGYIASGYRKDKIWLRRTKPAKRDYRVLLAVDDSESMKKTGAGEMALRALATLAVGMNQLEIGELGIASFGEDMKLLHPFHLPFSSESGTDMVMNFKFDQKRTRTSLCVESAISALESMGGSSSMQLVFLVSDGRIERDSRDKLKRLIREMMEKNILLAMIIVEGENKKKDSIVNMKEVTFEKGKPVVKRFIEDYPFPYYIILEDMAALPEILGDALRQWFEMLTHLQGSR